eukprot:COSAG06_NODE_336_length_17272_cov_50.456647_9_plen_275_part_00
MTVDVHAYCTQTAMDHWLCSATNTLGRTSELTALHCTALHFACMSSIAFLRMCCIQRPLLCSALLCTALTLLCQLGAGLQPGRLIGGTWPDNEPAVSCMDWTTGQVNAKYWVINMLAMTVGTKDEKTIVASNVTVSGGPPPPAPPKIGQIGSGTCGVTAFSDDCSSESDGCFNTTTYGIKTLAECVAKVKTCGKNGNFASFSLQNVSKQAQAQASQHKQIQASTSKCKQAQASKPMMMQASRTAPPLASQPVRQGMRARVHIAAADGGGCLVAE